MSRKIEAVIGAHYGDEGKGRCVDFLVARSPGHPIVVRHNSGAQAGHTVVSRELNVRHVHSHVGSGTLRGAPTLLCHKFVVNPPIFNDEHALLAKQNIFPKVFVDANCTVSTPIDALLNQLVESCREQRHGSCGIGFGETIWRNEERPELELLVGDDESYALKLIPGWLTWFGERLRQENIELSRAPEELQRVVRSLLLGEFKWSHWLQHLELAKRRMSIVVHDGVLHALRTRNHIIFEGAQGLELHQDHPNNAPHVTWCRTGLQDIVELLATADAIDATVEPWYCTRSYLTRHGDGYLPAEVTPACMTGLGFKIDDPTNRPNAWQGALRFSPIIQSFEHVMSDVRRAYYEQPAVRLAPPSIMISCCDQAPPDFVKSVINRAALVSSSIYLGYGPSSEVTERYEERRAAVGSVSDNVVEPKAPDAGEQEPGVTEVETNLTPEEDTTTAEA